MRKKEQSPKDDSLSEPEVEFSAGLGGIRAKGPLSWVNRTVIAFGVLLLAGLSFKAGYFYGALPQSNPFSTCTSPPTYYTPCPTLTAWPTCTPCATWISSASPPSPTSHTLFPEATLPVDEVWWKDEFLDNKNNWQIGSVTLQYANAQSSILGGKLHIEGETQNHRYEYFLQVPVVKVKDFCLSVDSEFTSGSNLSDTGISFKWRASEQEYYLARFYMDGTYRIFVIQKGEVGHLRALAYSAAINKGGSHNQYKICDHGEKMMFYVNGSRIDTVEDGNIDRAGKIYLGLYLPSQSRAALIIDDLMISH